MKITICSSETDLDPLDEYTDDEFSRVELALNSAYAAAILAEYPESEINFDGTDSTYNVRVTDTGLEDPCEIEKEVQDLCEKVWEIGNFWI